MNKLMKCLGLQLIAAATLAGFGASGASALDECPQPWGEEFFEGCYETPAFCWDVVGQETNPCVDYGCKEDQDNCPGSTGQVALWGVRLQYENMP